MGVKSLIPYAGDYKVRKQIDNLFSRQMLGAVIVGKFIGDYVAIIITRVFGTDWGYGLGIVLSVVLFIYWEQLEDIKEEAEEKVEDVKEDGEK